MRMFRIRSMFRIGVPIGRFAFIHGGSELPEVPALEYCDGLKNKPVKNKTEGSWPGIN